MKIRTVAPTRNEAFKHIEDAFEHFAEARRTLTEMEFKHFIASSLPQLGYGGFVSSIGQMISEASAPSRSNS